MMRRWIQSCLPVAPHCGGSPKNCMNLMKGVKMAEYIEREAALAVFQNVCAVCMALVDKPMCGECSVADTVRKVKSIPSADVQPVVHGKNLNEE